MANTILTLLYLFITVIQASPIQLSNMDQLSNVDSLSNTTKIMTEKSLFKRNFWHILFEPDTYIFDILNEKWNHAFHTGDHQPTVCRESEAIHGYWVQSCCFKGSSPSRAFSDDLIGNARLLKKYAKYYLANPNYYRKDLSLKGVCTPGAYKDERAGRACLSWSREPEFDISDMLQWYIIHEGKRCSDRGRHAQIHIVPKEGEYRLNVCIKDYPECPPPHQDRVPGCGSNDAHGKKLPCPDPPPEHRKPLHQEEFEPWAIPHNTTQPGSGRNDMEGNRIPYPKNPEFYDKVDISNCTFNDENGNKIPCPEKPHHGNDTVKAPSEREQWMLDYFAEERPRR